MNQISGRQDALLRDAHALIELFPALLFLGIHLGSILLPNPRRSKTPHSGRCRPILLRASTSGPLAADASLFARRMEQRFHPGTRATALSQQASAGVRSEMTLC